MGWAGKRNGELLNLAAGQFDVFVTVDRNLPKQYDLSQYDLVIIVLVARSNPMRAATDRLNVFERSLLLPRPASAHRIDVRRASEPTCQPRRPSFLQSVVELRERVDL